MTSLLYYYLVIGLEVAGRGQTSNSSPMNNFNFNDCRKAVNQATFRPTAERKAAATKLLQEALDFVANLEEVKESKKATKRRRKTTKSRKATPTQRVADRQEKAFHGKADTPVKPSKKARTASVEAAKESAKAVSVATGAAAKAAKKAEIRKEAVTMASPAPMKVTQEPKASKKAVQPKVVASESQALKELREQLTALTECVALMMQSEIAYPSNEVSLEEAGIK